MKLLSPELIVVEKSALALPYTPKILSKFDGVELEVVDDVKNRKKPSSENYNDNVLMITDYKGNIIKKCPGSKGVLCCNYYVANLINGCPYSCTYCILRDYINCGSVMVCANIDKFFDELDKKRVDGFILRVGTGELADSLAFDPDLELTNELLPRLKDYPDVILELKTKSANIENILRHGDACSQVVIGWSLNPQEIIDSDEKGAVSLLERFLAAKRCADAGFRVSFHFDPVILIDGWEDKYKSVVDMFFSGIDCDKIAWVSVGGLRFTPSLKKIYQNHYPNSKILAYGEFVMCPDGKYRYFRKYRVDMYRKMVGFIKNYGSSIPVYFCMEPDQVWREVFNCLPCEKHELSLTYNPYPY